MMPTIPDQNQVRLVDRPQATLGHLARRGPIWSPAKPRWLTHPRLGQQASTAVGDIGMRLVGTAFGAAVTYVGIRSGLKDKGFPQVLGWIVGIGTGIATLLALGGVVTSGVQAIAGKKPPAAQ